MTFRQSAFSAVLVVALSAASAIAGPFRDAEAQLSQAYADYRTALFQTNQKNQAATDSALAGFTIKWSALAAAWKANPPPQYADDSKLTETLDAVTRIAREAQTMAGQGDLAKSHEVLEEIRDRLGDLRARNSVITFSDRMNSYHTVMEHAFDMPEMTQASALEHAAVLAHLAKDIAANKPSGVDVAAFEAALKAIEASVAAFQNAARSGDKAAIDSTRKALKQSYSRMFLRFG